MNSARSLMIVAMVVPLITQAGCGPGGETEDLLSMQQDFPRGEALEAFLGEVAEKSEPDPMALEIVRLHELVSSQPVRPHLALPPEAGEETIPRADWKFNLDCWPGEEDTDQDGYAAEGVDPETFVQPWYERLRCPDGYVAAGNDCDDSNPLVHPARAEEARNSIDDDCDTYVDEWEYNFRPDALLNAEEQYTMFISVNDSMSPFWELIGADLFVRIRYERLDRHPDERLSFLTPIHVFYVPRDPEPDFAYTYATLTGLRWATVYRSQIEGVYVRYGTGDLTRLDVVLDPDEWYYTTTTREDDAVSIVRTQILMQGFYEYFLQMLGYVGRTGEMHINGTRYGARTYRSWCSEFYSWVADQGGLDGIDGRTSVSSLTRYFNATGRRDQYFEVDSARDLVGNAFRGDYLTLNDDDHSAMFLAVDSNGDLWRLEGNAHNVELDMGQSVAIKNWSGHGLTGYGHISSRHLP